MTTPNPLVVRVLVHRVTGAEALLFAVEREGRQVRVRVQRRSRWWRCDACGRGKDKACPHALAARDWMRAHAPDAAEVPP